MRWGLADTSLEAVDVQVRPAIFKCCLCEQEYSVLHLLQSLLLLINALLLLLLLLLLF